MNLQNSVHKRAFTILLAIVFSLCSLTTTAAQGPEEILGFYAEEYSGRIDPAIRISADGRKMVYVVKEKGFNTSLEGWLSPLPEGWSASDAAQVYLYDLATRSRTLLYEGKFGAASVNNQTVLQSLEGGFSVDINRDASKVVISYSAISMNA
ncbi:hypothetical protein E3V39_03835 [Gammaproteobacteria bacterium LSUCC0112]|nr:hypothetical protein E3V39_03835 [Gammaproteobacteria bacterium LSUCC0112]